MSLDISSLLLSSGISNVSELRNVVNNASDEELSSAISEFSQLLLDETNKLQKSTSSDSDDVQALELINALDKSILGNGMTGIDTKELVKELTLDGRNEEVIKELTTGQMMGVVFASSDDDDDNDSTIQSLSTSTSTADDSTESLADKLETIISSIGQITADV